MDIQEHVTESQRESLLVTNIWSSVEDGYGRRQMPIIHLRGRTREGEDRYCRITGFRPFMFISEQEFVQRRDELEGEMNRANSDILDYEQSHKGIDKRTNRIIPLVKLILETPYDVRDLRDEFERHWEADIQYTQRALLSWEIGDTINVPTKEEFDHTEVKSAESIEVEPRIVTTDIEVAASGVFPDIEFPDIEISCLASHDSYSDSYWAGILHHDEWEDGARLGVLNCYDDRELDPDINIYHSEKEMLSEYISVVNSWNPDILTGWNSSGFDYPYLVNKAFQEGCYSIRQWSASGDVDEIEDHETFGPSTNRQIKGVQCWDAMDAYESAQFHSLKSSALDYVAEKELGWGKDDIDDYREDWIERPADYLRYNIRDVEATVGIMKESELVSRWADLQQLTSTQFMDANHNKNVIDNKFLQKALDYDS